MNELYRAGINALTWLEKNKDGDCAVARALRKALSNYATPVEPVKQEPVAWVTAKESFCGFPKLVFSETQKDGYKPLYAAPVRTKDLTDDELLKIWQIQVPASSRVYDFARAVIAADREKNK